MPKIGMEPLRRSSLVAATIAEVGRAGSLDVTVGQIAKRAGVSTALAHHYFGSKEQIFLSAMRHILRLYAEEVARELAQASTPLQRVEAIIRASFAPANFEPATVTAWLNFYVQARNNPEAARLLSIYQRRLRSNLLAGLRALLASDATTVADGLAAMIDGLYIRQALAAHPPSAEHALNLTQSYLTASLKVAA